MAKYIDADWLMHYVLNSDALLMPQTERAKFARLLDAAPKNEDVIEVVRCKDCVNSIRVHGNTAIPPIVCKLRVGIEGVDALDYCSDGERWGK